MRDEARAANGRFQGADSRLDSQHKNGYLQVLQKAGATGLEPATSG